MTLTRVKDGLRNLEAATASQLAAEVGLSRLEVETALEFWVRRGDVEICGAVAGPACGTTCTKCPIGQLPGKRAAASPVVYEWITS